MQVHCQEGLAIHLGPEPCVCIREDAGEASAGDCIGQPLSRETSKIPGADAFQIAEGNTDGRGVVVDPGMCGRFLDGNREVSCLACGRTPQARIGKARSRSR